ncbi:hypothetical protein BX600DRAFT_230464 [Xylariales sp. PMI_506]|nr:hypothetical protein BX600DRAFT_230464 [Xylariales sp. PMI_506]
MTSPLLRSLGATTVLDHYLRQSGGEQSLSAAVERPRFLLLRQACAQEDVFFVALHQLFCVWSRNNSEAHKLCVKGRHDTSLVDNAFGLLGTILKHNSTIRPEHLQWFASFPRPLDHLHSAYPGYAKTLNQVLNCLVRLSSYWMVVNNEHRRLGYPLLVDEMLSVLWLYSPILQTIFFRASRRTLGVLDNPIGTQMDQIFGRDQESHRDANGSFSPRVTTNFQQDPQNAVLITRYLALTRPAMAGRASPQPQVPNSGQQQPERHPNAMPGVRTGLQTTVANGNRSSTAVFDQQHRVVPAASSHDQMMRTQSSHQFAQSPAYATFTSLPGQPPMSQETLNSPIHGHFPIVNTSDSTNVNQGASHLQGGSYVTSSSPPLMSAIVPSQSAPHNYQYAQHQQPPMVRRTSQQFVQISSPRLAQMQQHWTSPQMSNNSNLPSHPQNVITESLQSPSIPVSMLNSSSCGQTATSTDSVSNMSSWVVELNNHHLVLQQQHQQQQLQLQLQQQQRQRQQQQLQQQQQQQDILQRPLPNPTRPVSIQTQSRQPSQSALNTTFARSLSRIGISPADYPHDPYERKSLENSLHQAHLRSPRRVPKNYPTLNPPEKHFQSIKYLALQPTPIPQQQLLHFLNFVIGETDYAKISKDVLVHDDSLPVNMFWDGSLRVRLRCSFKSKGANSFNLSEWVIADTNWPDHIFMQLNDRPLTIKRKQHHHKDQPIEIGAFVRPGMNTLKITVPFAKPIPNGMKPFIAVEIVETLSLSSVRALNNLQPEMVIPVENTKALIQRRLAGSSSHDDDDDEIAMVISDLTINLADPFSYTMFTTPVRGQACTHLECFDLDTWLETRPSKKSCVCGAKQTNCKLCPKEPSLADKWRCPICQADARPFSLRVDGFLVEVRESLLAQDLSKVKEIIVSADGFWRPVIPDDDSDMDGDEFSRPGSSSGPSHPTNAQKTPVEVILLDDD